MIRKSLPALDAAWVPPSEKIMRNKRETGETMYTGKHAQLRPLQPAFIMAATGEAVTYRELERAATGWRTSSASAG